MEDGGNRYLGRAASAAAAALLFIIIYILWTGARDVSDMAVFSIAAVLTSALFVRGGIFPRRGPKAFVYAVAYVPFLFIEIVKANFDVASRIVRPRIPLNPGIVAVKTRLRTPIGRAVLANSITLTPGTLSVEIKGDTLYIHWIDVKGGGRDEEAAGLVEGFERYLEVIFG